MDTGALWLRNEIVIQCVSLYICAKADACKVVDNMPVTLSQMYVETGERKFRHKALGCSDDFTKVLKNIRHEYHVEFL
jgi:hypothetical protein